MALVRDQEAAVRLEVSRRYLNDKSGIRHADERKEGSRVVCYYDEKDIKAWVTARDARRAG